MTGATTVQAPHSATLLINEVVAERRRRGERVLHLGFGEAGLPVLDELVDVLHSSAGENAYGPVAGSEAARAAVAGYLARRSLPTAPEQVVLAPGSKALLYALIAGSPGDVVLPAPSWVSYAAQAAMSGRHVVWVPAPAEFGGICDPDRLEGALRAARADGADPRILVVTLPDNPTGTVADADAVHEICRLAERHHLTVISDEIYRDLAADPAAVTSPARILADRVVVTGGLSKNLALGGWRIGFARLPDTAWGRRLLDALVGVASEIWSSMPTPMQRVAEYAFDEPEPVVARVAASRRLHSRVATAVHALLTGSGARCRRPTAAFYLYPDLEPLRPAFSAQGAEDAAGAARLLLERYGIGVLPGDAFGDDPEALRFRVATSLLYGQGSERQAALEADDPASLPWIAESLQQLREGLAALAASES